MSARDITRVSAEELIRRKGEERTDWERLRREAKQGIEPTADPEEGEFDWSRARVVMPATKTGVYMRLDADVIAFFKEQGRGYQTRINAVLRGYMEAQRQRPGVNEEVAAKRSSRGANSVSVVGPKARRSEGGKRRAGQALERSSG